MSKLRLPPPFRTSQPEPFNICLVSPTPQSGSEDFHIKVFECITLSSSTSSEAVASEISSSLACTKYASALYRRILRWRGSFSGPHIGIPSDKGSTEPSMA